jgi:hypothetical protein
MAASVQVPSADVKKPADTEQLALCLEIAPLGDLFRCEFDAR